MPYEILIATANQGERQYLSTQLDADGHTVYDANTVNDTVAKLSTHAVDVMLLGGLQRPAESPVLLRAIRAGQYRRIHPGQPVVTIGPADELTTLRAYEAGSDHHLPDDSSYLLLRAVLIAVARRTLENVTPRHIQVGALHVDTAAKIADYDGQPVRLSRREYDVLVAMASDPTKIFSRGDLARTVWGSEQARSGRTVDSHVTRLRGRLQDAGATGLVANSWGRGWALLDPMSARQQD